MKISRLSGLDEKSQLKVIRMVAANIAALQSSDMEKSPPENNMYVYQLISELSGKEDAYYDIKKRRNEEVVRILPLLEKAVGEADVPLMDAVRLSLMGNQAPAGNSEILDLDEVIHSAKGINPVIDDLRSLLERISELKSGSTVLYLADNAGEIVYDYLVVSLLAKRGLKVVVAVKDGPVVTDALSADALSCGIDKVAAVISNGTRCSGTPLQQCSSEFVDCFNQADLVISKGQGNFETLSDEKREIFFLFAVKCGVYRTCFE